MYRVLPHALDRLPQPAVPTAPECPVALIEPVMETSQAISTDLGFDGDEQGMIERFFASASTDADTSFIRDFTSYQTNNN